MKKLIFIASFLVVLIFLKSCNSNKNKEVNILPSKVSSSRIDLGWQRYLKPNPSNEMEDIGKIHNDGIDYYLKNYQQGEQVDSYKLHTQNFVCENSSFENCSELAKHGINNVIPKIFSLQYQPIFVSSKVNLYFSELISVIKTDTIVLNIEKLQDNILRWETTIINDISLSLSEKKVLLISGSVARHSSSYWYYQYILKENSDWANLDFTKRKKRCGFWCQIGKIVAIISADVFGGLEGAAAGAQFGPAGVYIGGAAGAIAGSVGMTTQLY